MNLKELLTLLEGVRRSGNGYVGLCPAHHDRRPSLSIAQGDDRILLHCFVDCRIETICAALKIGVTDLFNSDASHLISNRSIADRRDHARRIWLSSSPSAGTVVETYLRNRGITIRLPSSIRFIPLMMHHDYGWPFPALVAGLQNDIGSFAAISVTWLCADGSDKAPVDPPRKVYGPYTGSAVRLAPAGETFALAEGLETGLSIVQACPELPVWCAMGAKNLSKVAVPEFVRKVIIAADADATGEQAARVLAERMKREGRQALIARPRGANDFNELIL
jgi:hypothetical protein